MNTIPSKLFVIGQRLISALILTFSLQILAVNPVSASATFTIVDTLGAATPSTQFQLAGAGGFPISSDQQLGPMFVLTQPMVITEIGVFLTQCEVIGVVIDCPSLAPIEVQIRPAVNGMPDLTKNLGTFILSSQINPEVYSYEVAHPNLRLKQGTYFAIFVPQENGATSLLSSASDPFLYHAGTTTVGFVLQPGDRTQTSQLSLAVRILGKHGRH